MKVAPRAAERRPVVGASARRHRSAKASAERSVAAFTFHALIVALLCAALTLAGCVQQPRMAIEPAPELASCRQLLPPPSLPVTWIGPTASRDRTRLDRWCAAVGPIVLDAAPATDPPPVDTLAVVVWNVHEGGGDLDRLIAALTGGALTGGHRPDAFVLLLQEVYRRGEDVPAQPAAGSSGPRAIVEHPPAGARRSAVDLARDRGLAIVYAPSMRNGEAGERDEAEDRGNAIVSMLPMADVAAIELPFERQRRVAVAATIGGRTTRGDAWTLRVVDVHLDTSLALTRGGPLAARRRQAHALIEALESSSLPTVAGGDFNTWLGDREPAIGALRDAFPETSAVGTGATWHGPLGSRAALDRVFVRHVQGHVSVRRLADRFGSDHYPLLAMIDVGGGPG